ncbi:MAG: substrate-binding domain-containing protein [Firmicutes bacterium]|nr:substrate-binding domain-containing protein [Bacillota bacterium]
MGIGVPSEGAVAVASFDNSFYSQIGSVPITSLAHKASRTGKVAAAMLLDILSSAHPQSRLLEWELIRRGSA